MNNVMVDIECLGTSPGSVIVSIGAVKFDITRIRVYGKADDMGMWPSTFRAEGAIGDKFYITIDVLNSLLAGLTVDSRTCAWWATQSYEAKAALDNTALHTGLHQGFRMDLDMALEAFAGFVDGAKTIWAKGPDFDLVLLHAAYKKANLDLPWKYKRARDVRTVLALGKAVGAFEGEAVERGTAHNAQEDAEYQARQVIRVYEKLGQEVS